MNISARSAASPFSPAKLSLTIATNHSNRHAYTNFATLSLTTVACAAFRVVTIFSLRVTICFLIVHFLNSESVTPKNRVARIRAGSSSSMDDSFRAWVTLTFPRCRRAERSLKTAHCFSTLIPTVERACWVARNSSASSTPAMGVEVGPPCLR